MTSTEKGVPMLDEEVSVLNKEVSTPGQETPVLEEAAAPTSDNSSSKTSIKAPDNGESADYFMSGTKLHVLIFSLGLAVLLMALDMSILTTAIPLITEKFQSTADIAWYMSAYSLTVCAFQPLGGKLYANFSLKWTFMAFFLVFEIGSAISGGATSSNMLIVGRAIAGSGAAGLMSGTLSIISVVVEMRLRALYTGILSSMFGIALICGPLIGGAFTEHVSWRWVFYINLPIGGLIIPVLVFMFKPPTRAVENKSVKERVKRLDLLGAAIFIPAIIMILIPLQWGGVTYPWNSGRIIGLFVGGGVVLILFGIYQWYRGDMAMIPPYILTERTVLLASLSAMWGMGAQAMLGLWMPEWFQVIKGSSPVKSGVNMLPAMLAQTVAAIIGGGLTTAFGYYNPWMLMGTALLSISSGLFTTFEVDTSSARWIGYQVIFGLGGGLFLTAPMVAVQAVLTAADTPIALATVTFFQMFGGSLFTALSQTIFNEQLLKELMKNVPGVNIGALLAAGTSGISKVATPEQLPGILQSYNVALMDTFYLAAAVTAASFFTALWLPWINVKGKNLAASGAA